MTVAIVANLQRCASVPRSVRRRQTNTNNAAHFLRFSACVGAFPPAFELMIKTLREYIGVIDVPYILAYLCVIFRALRIFISDDLRTFTARSVPLTHSPSFGCSYRFAPTTTHEYLCTLLPLTRPLFHLVDTHQQLHTYICLCRTWPS